MLALVKLALRISTTAFDSEINGLIAAARADLILSGILSTKANDDTDSLIQRAVIVYVKAHFGFDNAEAERFEMAYSNLKRHLSLSTEYSVEVV